MIADFADGEISQAASLFDTSIDLDRCAPRGAAPLLPLWLPLPPLLPAPRCYTAHAWPPA